MAAATAGRMCAVRDVPILRVARRGDRHHIHDLTVDVAVRLDTASTAWLGPDALQRGIAALAAQHGADELEALALALGRYCVGRLDGVQHAEVEIRTRSWDRLAIGGRPRDRDLLGATAEERIAQVECSAREERLRSGLRELLMLSSYAPRDARITVCRVRALWSYGWADVPFDTQWQQVRRALTEAYAERGDDSGGPLAEAMARAALAETPALSDIRITLETSERQPIDLASAGMENRGDVFGAPAQARTLHEVALTRTEIP